ncbi:hypothetical protein MP631_02505 [Xanthomonas phaseoli pv. phaseoli]|nr:hypothetical protein MP631_02505 [Xanthomonas phaseoli pv. phaseoli]
MGTDTDIVSLVRQALQDMGCADKVDDALNPHLPICFNFRDGSEIRIDTGVDGVRFVAPMPSITEVVLTHASAFMATFLLRSPSPLFLRAGRSLSLVMKTRCRFRPSLQSTHRRCRAFATRSNIFSTKRARCCRS